MMGTRTVRAFLAMSVVGVFMLITAFMAIYPLVSPVKVGLNEYADFFAKTASVYTGIIGVIIGFYFGRHTDENEKTTAKTPPKTSPPTHTSEPPP